MRSEIRIRKWPQFTHVKWRQIEHVEIIWKQQQSNFSETGRSKKKKKKDITYQQAVSKSTRPLRRQFWEPRTITLDWNLFFSAEWRGNVEKGRIPAVN